MNFVKKALLMFALIVAISGCGNKDEKNNKVEKKTESVQHFEILIGNIEARTNTMCNWTFEIKNSTKLDFTDLAFDMIAKDADGNVVEKTVVRSNNATSNSDVIATRLLSGCQLIKSFEFVGISNTSIVKGQNGQYINRDLADSIKIKSASRVASIAAKSNGGEVLGIVANVVVPVVPVAEVKKNEDENLTVVDTGSNGIVFYQPDSKSCKKVVDMTTDMAEGWARNSNTAVSSIRFLRMKITGDDCALMIDTSTGPMECLVGSVVKTSKGDYLASAYKVNGDGTKMTVKGLCSKPW
jgi:hypothetical protein